MKVVLYMAVSANGLVARENNDTSFVSATEWNNFSEMVRKSGNLVIGSKTYRIMLDRNEFSRLPKNIFAVVVSQNMPYNSGQKNHFVVRSPKEALLLLSKKRFKTALVAGGAKLNASFMKEKLADEIFLDIEPVIFGKGISLFFAEDFENRLKLVSTKKLSRNELQLHYKIVE